MQIVSCSSDISREDYVKGGLKSGEVILYTHFELLACDITALTVCKAVSKFKILHIEYVDA